MPISSKAQVDNFQTMKEKLSNLLVGQVGLEPTTALSTEFTVRGDTNYAVLTYIGTGGWIRTNEYRSLVVNNRFELLSSFWM